MIAEQKQASEQEKKCCATVISENRDWLQDQHKCQFLGKNGRKSGKRICNHQFKGTPGMPSLPRAAQVITNLPMSKWSHCLQHLSWKDASVPTMPGTSWQVSLPNCWTAHEFWALSICQAWMHRQVCYQLWQTSSKEMPISGSWMSRLWGKVFHQVKFIKNYYTYYS